MVQLPLVTVSSAKHGKAEKAKATAMYVACIEAIVVSQRDIPSNAINSTHVSFQGLIRYKTPRSEVGMTAQYPKKDLQYVCYCGAYVEATEPLEDRYRRVPMYDSLDVSIIVD